jgi:hypothetical protein
MGRYHGAQTERDLVPSQVLLQPLLAAIPHQCGLYGDLRQLRQRGARMGAPGQVGGALACSCAGRQAGS